jgi:hypothetical protein
MSGGLVEHPVCGGQPTAKDFEVVGGALDVAAQSPGRWSTPRSARWRSATPFGVPHAAGADAIVLGIALSAGRGRIVAVCAVDGDGGRLIRDAT